MTQLGGMVFLELFIGGILGVACHYFFQSSSRNVISTAISGMFYLHEILKKIECHKDQF
jgi:hypothetical protein